MIMSAYGVNIMNAQAILAMGPVARHFCREVAVFPLRAVHSEWGIDALSVVRLWPTG